MTTNINFESAPVPGRKSKPGTLTGAERAAAYRARNPVKAAESHARYVEAHRDRVEASQAKFNAEHGTARRDSVYLGRPFCAWDGEGVSLPSGEHIYNLFSGKCGEQSIGIERPTGLHTAEIFETLLDFAEQHPDAIHIIYGGSYDFNMWLSDLDKVDVQYVYSKKFATWGNYRISWRRGKSFYVCRMDSKGKRIGAGVTVYDIISFFQSSFVAACDSYLGGRFIHRDMIVANKAARGSFKIADLETVAEYNDAELDNLILLATELRERLNKVGLRPRRWDSCGAIAAALLKQYGVDKLVKEISMPDAVADAERHAYAGGRFEMIRYGHTDSPVYEYDINSAYPSALRDVPDLTRGKWRHVTGNPGRQDFALYHIKSHTADLDIPAPLFRRDRNGSVCYPPHVIGWYWSPEFDVWSEYVKRGLSTGEVLEAWIFEAEPDVPKPFAFIEPLYMKRRALKKAGDGAHVGIKLALNSLYGKLAQQVGAEEQPSGEWRLPPFHCMSWAGFTTSHCRATILTAVLNDLDSVVAFETDAVFTTRKLDVPTGSNLGEFEYVEFSNLTYCQSGMYFADSPDGSIVAKTRGVDRGELVRADALQAMAEPMAKDRFAVAKLTRFVGAGIALNQSWAKWKRWETVTKRMMMGPSGKRTHTECDYCQRAEDGSIILGELHTTFCPMLDLSHSKAFPVIWINPNPEMKELEELRNNEPVYDDE